MGSKIKFLRLIMISIFVSVIFTLSSCAPAEPVQVDAPEAIAPQTPVEPVEDDIIAITVVTSYGGDDGNRQNYEKAVRDFEADTGYFVSDKSAVSSESWKNQVLSDFESDEEPDVLFFFTGVDSNRIIESGKVVPIDEIRDVYPQYAANMKDNMLAKSLVDEKHYAVPVNGYWEGLYVNKKILAECGVPVPDADTTWDEFLESCAAIADNGYIPIAASLAEVPHYWFEFCIFNNGSISSHQNLPLSADDEVGSIWAKGLEDIKTLYDMGFFPENTGTMTSAEADALIADNKAAFMIEGSWKLGWFSENAADVNNYTVTYVPGKGGRASSEIIGGLSMGYFITRKAWENPAKQEACVAFVEAMTRDDVVETFGAAAVTALQNGIKPQPDANNLIKDALEMTKNCTGITVAVGDSLFTEARAELFMNIINVANGTMTAKEAIENALVQQGRTAND